MYLGPRLTLENQVYQKPSKETILKLKEMQKNYQIISARHRGFLNCLIKFGFLQ